MNITGATTGRALPGVAAGVRPAPQPLPAGAPPAPLQSETLAPARAALGALPDIDAARVAALRDALARGELPFDPVRLARLVRKFHGGR